MDLVAMDESQRRASLRSQGMVPLTALGPDGEKFEIDVGRGASVVDIQSRIGRELLMMEQNYCLIDVFIGKSKPLDVKVQPFRGLEIPEEGYTIKFCVVGRVPRLLRRAKLKNLDKRTRLQRTPLHLAVATKELQTCKELLEGEADLAAPPKLQLKADEEAEPEPFVPGEGFHLLNARDVFGDTPLMIASIMGQVEIVELLLKHKAETHHKNPMGRSALMLACEMGHEETSWLLLDAGADFRADTIYNWKKQVPLRTSSRSGAEINDRKDIIEVLNQHEAELLAAEQAAIAEQEALAQQERDEIEQQERIKQMKKEWAAENQEALQSELLPQQSSEQ